MNRDLEIRELYNNEDAFNLSKTYLGAYRARFNANLAFFDGLDGKTDWPIDEHGNHPLTELLLADFLVVDMSKPFRETSYFEIEEAVLKQRAHATCGGRWLNEDIIDFILTLYINAGSRSAHQRRRRRADRLVFASRSRIWRRRIRPRLSRHDWRGAPGIARIWRASCASRPRTGRLRSSISRRR